MPLTITCPVCGISGDLPDGTPDGVFRCPRCQTSFTLTSGRPANPRPAADPAFGVWIDSPTISAPISSAVAVSVQAQAPVVTPEATSTPPPSPAAPQPVPEPTPATPVADDIPGHLDWLRDETRRFEGYVARELAALAAARQEATAFRSQVEQHTTLRTQVLNRQHANVTARAAELDRREAEVAGLEARLEARAEELDRLAVDVAGREAAVAEREARRAELDADVARLERRVAELGAAAAPLDDRERELEARAAGLLAERAALARRLAEVDRADEALRRRLAELDEVEQAARQELEDRERQLEGLREALSERVLTALTATKTAAGRRSTPVDVATPPPRDWSS